MTGPPLKNLHICMSLLNPFMNSCFLVVVVVAVVLIFTRLLKDLFFYVPNKAKENCNHISL